jgi:hypothetical protein
VLRRAVDRLLAAGTVVLFAAPAAGGPPAFDIAVSGDRQARFEADCEVMQNGEARQVRLAGHPPASRRVDGDALRCRIVQHGGDGRLEVRIEGPNGNRQTVATQGDGSSLTLRMR